MTLKLIVVVAPGGTGAGTATRCGAPDETLHRDVSCGLCEPRLNAPIPPAPAGFVPVTVPVLRMLTVTAYVAPAVITLGTLWATNEALSEPGGGRTFTCTLADGCPNQATPSWTICH